MADALGPPLGLVLGPALGDTLGPQLGNELGTHVANCVGTYFAVWTRKKCKSPELERSRFIHSFGILKLGNELGTPVANCVGTYFAVWTRKCKSPEPERSRFIHSFGILTIDFRVTNFVRNESIEFGGHPVTGTQGLLRLFLKEYSPVVSLVDIHCATESIRSLGLLDYD
jgi:hypothetical protein